MPRKQTRLTFSCGIYRFLTQDALYDLAWSEVHHDQVLVASGDGSVKLFDATVPTFPIANWKNHVREVLSVNWNMRTKDTFCSSSWDGTVKVFVPDRPQPIRDFPTHSCTYSADFNPLEPNILSCVASDSLLRVWDLREPTPTPNHLALQIPIHGAAQAPSMLGQPGMGMGSCPPSEALTHDWNKYRSTVITTAGVDRVIRTFDIRAPHQGPLSLMLGHEYAIRKVTWSPHLPDLLLSAGYDMTCRVWFDGSSSQPPNGPIPYRGEQHAQMNTHSEFVTGVDWCLFGNHGWAASVGWDENLYVWDVKKVAGII